MTDEAQEQPQSEILSEEQVDAVVNDKEMPTEESVLPSDQENSVPSEDGLIAGKFKTQDDLLKAYKELEKKLGTPQQEEEELVHTPQEDPEYVEWRTQKAEKELLDPVGGVDLYKQASAWAAENLSDEESNEYNKALDNAKGNPDVVRVLARSLIDKYKAGTAEPGGPIHSGETAKVERTKGYATKSDMMKDMADPRYERDESYRQQVAAKVAATDESSWYKTLPKY